jgi:SAM-dependent methyltransferase
MKFLPFTYNWIIRNNLKSVQTILDVGCGDGTQMMSLNFDKEFEVTGIDLYKPYLEKAKKSGFYTRVLSADVREIKQEKQSFDAVISSQVVEHLEKEEALELMKSMEKIAKKTVIVATTNGFFPFDPLEGRDGNPLQVHKSGWDIMEMRKKGYRVYGQGLGIVYKPNGLAHKIENSFLRTLLFGFSYLLSPLTYYFPQISAYIIAVKDNKR